MIPLRATNVIQAKSWPKLIVLHHTSEFTDSPKFQFDNDKFQTGQYINYNYTVKHRLDLMYHYIVERVENDYHIIVGRPLLTICPYDDIPKEYQNSIHIAFMGNYDKDIPMLRMYRVLSYRLLVPLIRNFNLNKSDIVFHSTISDEPITCPGEFIEMDKLQNQLMSVLRRQSLRRG